MSNHEQNPRLIYPHKTTCRVVIPKKKNKLITSQTIFTKLDPDCSVQDIFSSSWQNKMCPLHELFQILALALRCIKHRNKTRYQN